MYPTKKFIAILLSILFTISLFSENFQEKSFWKILNERLRIQITDGPYFFNSGNLYDYLDGGADNYIKNGLIKLTTADCMYKKIQFTIEIYTFKNNFLSLKMFKKEAGKNFKTYKKGYIYIGKGLVLVHKKNKILKIIFFKLNKKTDIDKKIYNLFLSY